MKLYEGGGGWLKDLGRVGRGKEHLTGLFQGRSVRVFTTIFELRS